MFIYKTITTKQNKARRIKQNPSFIYKYMSKYQLKSNITKTTKYAHNLKEFVLLSFKFFFPLFVILVAFSLISC